MFAFKTINDIDIDIEHLWRRGDITAHVSEAVGNFGEHVSLWETPMYRDRPCWSAAGHESSIHRVYQGRSDGGGYWYLYLPQNQPK